MYKLISSVKTTSESVDKTSPFPQGGILSPEKRSRFVERRRRRPHTPRHTVNMKRCLQAAGKRTDQDQKPPAPRPERAHSSWSPFQMVQCAWSVMVLLWLSENFGQDALDRHHSSGLPRNRPPSARRPRRKLIVNKDEKVGDFTAAFCWEMLMGIFQQSHSLRRGMNPQLQPSFFIYYRAVWGDS